MDTHTETQEITSQTVIRKDESFTFFTNQAEKTPTMLTETRQVEGIGPLTGIASEKTDGTGEWLIDYKMEIPPPKTKETTSQPVEGNPGENLVMLATLKSLSPDFTEILHRASPGRIRQENGGRSVVFDQWYEVDPKTLKSKVMAPTKPPASNSLVVPDGSYVRYSEFKLV